jgi:PUA domain protein
MVSIMKKKSHKYYLKDKQAKRLLQEAITKLGANIEQLLGTKTQVEMAETETADVFIFSGRPLLARSEGTLFPTLLFEELFFHIPRIIVDMGAVPFVCKGADVMAPGVLLIRGEFKEADLLVVVDERHGKALAVGKALFCSEEMKNIKRGKTIKILHYVGDRLWNQLKRS